MCGKTCLLIVFSQGLLPEACLHPTFENYVTVIDVQVELALWDTAGQEDHDRLRPLSYQDRDVVLTCLSIDSPDFLNNNTKSGRTEVHHSSPSAHIILAGKTNIRSDLLTLPDPSMKSRRTRRLRKGAPYTWGTAAYGAPGVLRHDRDGVR
ncbi:rho-related GTP-binding protein RhoA-B [Rhipicephalus sanguineus]|uniref:Uncharacterized protein n=1 Tax=Rhipicephalus sanguineus TaxID=34632 RepID=A0A9D4TDS9_RHISA|nr:rho-related GTP-binding protein RhoA-B [Rhipicephalus sanguineus]KAH7986584.1 hypothetical protein HPB52_024854 [Rhipicephalus sanguineus]